MSTHRQEWYRNTRCPVCLIEEIAIRTCCHHRPPAIETLEEMARALEVPMYQVFYEGENPPKPSDLPKSSPRERVVWGAGGKQARILRKFRRLLGSIDEKDRLLVLSMAQRMA